MNVKYYTGKTLIKINEKNSYFVAETDWEYTKTIELSADDLNHQELYLKCDMLDTLCSNWSLPLSGFFPHPPEKTRGIVPRQFQNLPQTKQIRKNILNPMQKSLWWLKKIR